MVNDKGKNPENITRRDFLGTVTTVTAGVGIAATCWPLINSMNPPAEVLEKSTTEVDLENITEGQVKTVLWQGKPVFIFHRTPEQIAAMRQKATDMIEPQPDEKRVKDPQWLVVTGLCTHLGCIPNKDNDGWLCPCHGSLYDNSGRVVRGPAPHNLDIPPYKFIADTRILIGEA